MGIVGEFGRVYKGISSQTMKQHYILYVPPIFEHASSV